MAIFYFHPTNSVALKLKDLANAKGFIYTNRYEMEVRLQKLIAEAGYDVWPTFHTVLGGLPGSINNHIPIIDDNELDNYALKLMKGNTSWGYVRIANGPKMSTVVGYCSSGANNPFALSTTQMAQSGIIRTSVVPRIMQ